MNKIITIIITIVFTLSSVDLSAISYQLSADDALRPRATATDRPAIPGLLRDITKDTPPTFNAASITDELLKIMAQDDYDIDSINLQDLFAYLNEHRPDVLEAGRTEDEKMAILFLAILRGEYYQSCKYAFKESEFGNRRQSRAKNIGRKAGSALSELKDVILPPERRTAFVLPNCPASEIENYKYPDGRYEERFFRMFGSVVDGSRRKFVAKWAKDYFSMLSGMSAMELEREWKRLSILSQDKSYMPLYRIPIREFMGDTSQHAHPSDLGYVAEDSLDRVYAQKEKKFIVCAAAKMNIYFNWLLRHMDPELPGDIKAIYPEDDYSLDYINENLAPIFIGEKSDLSRHIINRVLIDTDYDEAFSILGLSGPDLGTGRTDTSMKASPAGTKTVKQAKIAMPTAVMRKKLRMAFKMMAINAGKGQSWLSRAKLGYDAMVQLAGNKAITVNEIDDFLTEMVSLDIEYHSTADEVTDEYEEAYEDLVADVEELRRVVSERPGRAVVLEEPDEPAPNHSADDSVEASDSGHAAEAPEVTTAAETVEMPEAAEGVEESEATEITDETEGTEGPEDIEAAGEPAGPIETGKPAKPAKPKKGKRRRSIKPFGLSAGASAKEVAKKVIANKAFGFTNFGRMNEAWMSRLIDGDPDNGKSGILKKANEALAGSSIPVAYAEEFSLAVSKLLQREIPVITFPATLKNREDYCLAFSDKDVIAITEEMVDGERKLDDELLEIILLYLTLKPLFEDFLKAGKIEAALIKILLLVFPEDKVSKIGWSLAHKYITLWCRFRVNAERLERVLNEREKVSVESKEDRALLGGGLKYLIDQEPNKEKFYLRQYEKIMGPLIEAEYEDVLNKRKRKSVGGFYNDEIARLIHSRVMVRRAIEINGWTEDEIPLKISRPWFEKMGLYTSLRDLFARKIYRMLGNTYPGNYFDPDNPSEPHKWHQWEFKELLVPDGFWGRHLVPVVRHVIEDHEGWEPEEIGENVSFPWLKSVGLNGAFYTHFPRGQGLAAFFELVYPGQIDASTFYQQSPARRIALAIGQINRFARQGRIETAQQLWRQIMPDYIKYQKELPSYWVHLAKNAFIMEMFLASQSDSKLKRRWGFKEDSPKKILSAGSGPSISYSAWWDLKTTMEASGLTMPEVMDLDKEEVMLDHGANPNQRVGDMANPPFNDKSFDIYENASLMHISEEDYFDTLNSAWRLLEKDGLIVLTAIKKAFKPSFYEDLKNLGFKVLTEQNQKIRFSKGMMDAFAQGYGIKVAKRISTKLKNTYIIVAKKVNKRHLSLIDRAFSIFEDEAEADPEPDIEAAPTRAKPESVMDLMARRRNAKKGGRLSDVDVTAVIKNGTVIAETITQEDMDRLVEVIAELEDEGTYITLINIAKKFGCTVAELLRRLELSHEEFWALGVVRPDLEFVRKGLEEAEEKGVPRTFKAVTKLLGTEVRQVRRIVRESGIPPEELGFTPGAKPSRRPKQPIQAIQLIQLIIDAAA